MKTGETSSARKGQITTLLGAVTCGILGFILVCNLIIIIQGTLDPEKPPSILGITPMVVLSGSMSGSQDGHIEAGDLIFVGRADPSALEVGDVIAYMSGQTTVTHRITTIDTAENGDISFTTKGDANEVEDSDPVTEDQLIGIYRGRIPRVGDFALFLQQPLGMLLFIGIPLFAFLIYDILRRHHYAILEQKKATEMETELARLRALAGHSDIAATDSDSSR